MASQIERTDTMTPPPGVDASLSSLLSDPVNKITPIEVASHSNIHPGATDSIKGQSDPSDPSQANYQNRVVAHNHLNPHSASQVMTGNHASGTSTGAPAMPWGSPVPTNTNNDPAGLVPRVVSTLSSSSSFVESISSSDLILQPLPVAPTSNHLVTEGQPAPATGRRRQKTKIDQGSNNPPASGGNNSRRQKRLERNRESARLSRRRRKQYLEELEERVTQLSQEMDQGRRESVSQAVQTIVYKRRDLLDGEGEPSLPSLTSLETGLSRTSQELMVSNTFQYQQLKSLSMPASTRFILWLTLQNQVFFRGGRAASERLSAARIGERMLMSGTDKVAPFQSMWPLFCNDVVLSYEQEEKVRSFQRTILQSHQTWVNRHAAFASTKVMESAHDAVQALSAKCRQRESATNQILSKDQRIKFLAWASRNRESLSTRLSKKLPKETLKDKYEISREQHLAANLYVTNHRLQMVLQKIPRANPLITGTALKKMSRRPSFESLGCLDKKDSELNRDSSFDSCGSLKRSAAEMSITEGDERQQVQGICAQDAEAAAAPLVENMVGHVKAIIPPMPTSSNVNSSALGAISTPTSQASIPAPTPWAHMSGQAVPQAVRSATAAVGQVPISSLHPGNKHVRKSSFLPPHLNVVPEEMWPAEGDDDFLMSLVDEDWAIGEGVGMDM